MAQQPDYEQLVNKGIAYLGERPADLEDTPHTIVVVGPGRSGTSLISGSLHHLGVFMGEPADPPVFEDHKIEAAMQDKNNDSLRQQLAEYNQQHAVWGFKRPQATINHLNRIHKEFRNPIYVVTFRSYFAIANRHQISTGDTESLLPQMFNMHERYMRILEFLNDVQPYAMLVDYDKASTYREYFVDELASFCALQPDEAQINAAIEFIQPYPEEYMEITRTTKSRGALGKVTPEVIAGWACYKNDDRTAEVVLLIDGVEIDRIKADHFRPDLKRKNLHPDGKCGFRFTDFDPSLIHPSASVRVKITDDIYDLNNSPYVVSE